MMILLRGLHFIAAQYGDGLRPELLKEITPSPDWPGLERMGDATITADTDRKSAYEVGRHARCAEVVAMPLRERGVHSK